MEKLDGLNINGTEYSIGSFIDSGCASIIQAFDIELDSETDKGNDFTPNFNKNNNWSIEFLLLVRSLSEGTIIKKMVDDETKKGFLVGIKPDDNGTYRLYCEINGDRTQTVEDDFFHVNVPDGTSVASQEPLAENKLYHICLLFSPNCYYGYTRDFNRMFHQPIVRMYINGREQGVDTQLSERHFFTGLTNDCSNQESLVIGSTLDATIEKLVIYNGIIANNYIYNESVNSVYNKKPLMPNIIDSAQSYNMILDLDNDGDADDIGDVACSIALHRRKELNLLGFIVSVHRVANANVVHAIQEYYGYNLPIGLYKGDKCILYPGNTTGTANIATKFGITKTDADYSNDLLKYREYLYNAEDNSVVIVTTGSLTSVERLMKSGADGLIDATDDAYVSSDVADNLGVTGMELINRKVCCMLTVGNVFPSPISSTDKENNVNIDYSAWRYVTKNFPKDIVFSGGETGTFVWDYPLTVTPDDSETNPVLWGYNHSVISGQRGAWAHFLIDLVARGVRDMYVCSMPFIFEYTNADTILPVRYNAYGKRWFIRFAKGFCNTTEVKNEVVKLISERA